MTKKLIIEQLDWEKIGNLVPAIIQDASTLQVLMLGYMNADALQQTTMTNQVTFYSRSKQRLWIKGETSGNFLEVVDILADCDHDALLISVKPIGPCCHLNTVSCFSAISAPGVGLLSKLEQTIAQRYQGRPENSYTTKLFAAGMPRIAQKVGEEGVELALAAIMLEPKSIINESADLLFHLLVLLQQANIPLALVLDELRNRHEKVAAGV